MLPLIRVAGVSLAVLFLQAQGQFQVEFRVQGVALPPVVEAQLSWPRFPQAFRVAETEEMRHAFYCS